MKTPDRPLISEESMKAALQKRAKETKTPEAKLAQPRRLPVEKKPINGRQRPDATLFTQSGYTTNKNR